MKKLFFAIAIAFSTLALKANAQSAAPVPENYVLKTPEDYAKYQGDLVKTIDWLQDASWSEPIDNRKAANAFVIGWISGTKDVTITIEKPLAKLTEKNPELMVIFMGGYTKYALQHKADFDKKQANLAGVKAMVDKYNKETTHTQDGRMEKLAKLDQDGKLEEWVKSNF